MAREIYVENHEDGSLAAAESVVLSDSTGAYGIREKATGTVVAEADTATDNPRTGIYTYDIGSLDDLVEYEYCFKITRASGDIEYEAGEIPALSTSEGAESTLTLCYVELLSEVGYFLYGKTDMNDLSTDEQAVCDECVQAGYRQFLYPPAAEGIPVGYEWTFLRPTTYLETTEGDSDQDMPSDFGRLIGAGLTYDTDAQRPMVLADVGEGKIRRLRMTKEESGKPRVAGLRRKTTDGENAQGWEIMWYPTPDDTYTLWYRYEALVQALSNGAPYALGGIKYAETLKASCIAIADKKVNDSSDKMNDFLLLLAASIKRDRAEQAKFFGPVGCQGEYDENGVSRGLGSYTMTVSGQQVYPSE